MDTLVVVPRYRRRYDSPGIVYVSPGQSVPSRPFDRVVVECDVITPQVRKWLDESVNPRLPRGGVLEYGW